MVAYAPTWSCSLAESCRPLTTRCQLHKPETKQKHQLAVSSSFSRSNLSKIVGETCHISTEPKVVRLKVKVIQWQAANSSGIFTFQATWLTNWVSDRVESDRHSDTNRYRAGPGRAGLVSYNLLCNKFHVTASNYGSEDLLACSPHATCHLPQTASWPTIPA